MENKWLNKIRDFIVNHKWKDDRRLIIFLVCVGIATIFWFLNVLDKDYRVELTFPVRYTNLPKNKILAQDPPSHFELEVNAHGFSILRHKLSLSFSPLVFNVNQFTRRSMEKNDRSKFAIPSRRFMDRISDQISNELKVVHISPDTLYFDFDRIIDKKIRVNPNLKVSYEKQFYLNGEIKTRPDSVMVSGPESILDTLSFVLTKYTDFEDLDQSVQRNVSVLETEKYSVQPKRVVLNIPVEEFTQKQLDVPIEVIDIPEGVNVNLFPAKVRLSFMTGLSNFGVISPDDFLVNVRYQDILDKKEKLSLSITRQPANIQRLSLSVNQVEYLIEK